MTIGAADRVSATGIIHKDKHDSHRPILANYDIDYATFSWNDARDQLSGLPDGGLNIAFEAIDRHVLAGRGERTAIRWLSKNGSTRAYTYGDLQAHTARFADVLARFGIHRGAAVFSLLGRVPELYIAALGTLRHGTVFTPLFSAFGPEPVQSRMTIGDAAVLVTSEALYRRKIAHWRAQLPTLRLVLIVDGERESLPPDTVHLHTALASADPGRAPAATRPEDLALVHFTSGTTGKPKGVMHVHDAVIAHHITGQLALDFHGTDVFWCTADPGWVTGTSYGIIAPLTNCLTMIVDEAEFDAERWYRILQEYRVTVWYTAPTAIRMLMKIGTEVIRKYDLSALRFMASVGEPLNPEAVVWSNAAFGRPFHDNWWQTETGGIMIANYASVDIKPGSMGKPLPGVTAAIVEHSPDAPLPDQDAVVVDSPGVIGELALRKGWPSMMRGYLHEEARYLKCFAGDWYLTGDLALRDRDGYFWFVGRADDVIKSAGHLIGPFEVESCLLEHPAVAEAAVIGIPDPTAGQVVKAYVGLKDGFTPTTPTASRRT